MFQQPDGADGEAVGSETTKRCDTQLLSMATDMPPSKIANLISLLSKGGVAFVDNSGSTTGSILRNCERFIKTLRPYCTALWNSRCCAQDDHSLDITYQAKLDNGRLQLIRRYRCEQLARTDDKLWISMGGTYPSHIYDEYDPLDPARRGGFEWNCFTLVTDGQVSSSEVPPTAALHSVFIATTMLQVTKLAAHVHKTSHLPTVLAVATVEVEDNHPVSRYNVSVLFAHFTAARSAIVVVSK